MMMIDDMFFTMMYEYYINELEKENEATLQTRKVRLNRNRTEANESLYNDYFAALL